MRKGNKSRREKHVLNRQWRLRMAPAQGLSPENFVMSTEELSDEGPAPGKLLIRNRLFLCTPAQRGWMNAKRSAHSPAIMPGDPIIAFAGGTIMRSAHPAFPAGADVRYFGHWSDYQIVDPSVTEVELIEPGLSLFEGVAVYTLNMITAYAGLVFVGQPMAGETLVVSGAAGSTGSAALQIGHILGLRTIGIAGGADKCAMLRDEYGADTVIDYKTEDVAARLGELCPDGINIFYDNVGGAMLQAAVDNIARHGRIILCGQIAGYDAGNPAPGPRDMMQLVYGSVRMQGFISTDYRDRYEEIREHLRQWVEKGELRHREDVRQGFEQLPEIYGSLFSGSNRGTLVAVTDPSLALNNQFSEKKVFE
ncbi:NADP-dependent oxidoreductase (plasmid) [Sphingobium sp. SJ10-10]|uniref:NADP-dependent oxidoreductase n=1 Tax=Sphingobium sp. SJ10-10 TaxID=3114999 RepID=UPI003329B364